MAQPPPPLTQGGGGCMNYEVAKLLCIFVSLLKEYINFLLLNFEFNSIMQLVFKSCAWPSPEQFPSPSPVKVCIQKSTF